MAQLTASQRTEPPYGQPVTGVRIRVGSPTALLAAVPWLLTFQPARSVVVIGTKPPRGVPRLTLRYDLPDPPDDRLAAALARHALGVLAAQDIDTAAAVGYGSDELVDPVAAALRAQAPAAGITVTEFLRADGIRYWSYVCGNPDCCPPEGTPYDVTDHPVARSLRKSGIRVLASRAELAATVATVRGKQAVAMRRATRDAEAQFAGCAARLSKAGQSVSAGRLAAAIGVPVVRDAIARYRAGQGIGPDHAALLTVALRQVRVRDDAWARMATEHLVAHQRLWTDLTRLARPGYVAAPATLLAFTAWQAGHGALANVALDRALADAPGYSMAALIRQAIDAGAPPAMARLPMTPQEVADAYDDIHASTSVA